jgi:hypothetical protein
MLKYTWKAFTATNHRGFDYSEFEWCGRELNTGISRPTTLSVTTHDSAIYQYCSHGKLNISHFNRESGCKGINKAISATGCGGPHSCETMRFPHFLDNYFTDGCNVVSLMYRPPAPGSP